MATIMSPYAVNASEINGVTVSGTPAANSVLVATSATAAAWQAGASSATFNGGNPSSTESATLVMMGLGSTIFFTPASTGKCLIIIKGQAYTATGATGVQLGGRYGTGTAPLNGVAVTGTRFGSAADPQIRPAGTGIANGTDITLADILTLTGAQQYWFDLA